MNIKPEQIAKMIDISVLHTVNTEADIQFLINTARNYRFFCTFALSCYSSTLVEAFKNDDILVGAPIGFPSGAEMTKIKVFQARTLYDIGCDEFDMVMNIGLLKSKQFTKVENDIKAVHDSINGKPLKVIVEAMYLNNEELIDACKIVMNSGAEFVKTGTGWAPKPTELKHIEIISKTVGNKVKIKAAGGIRDYDTLCRMYEMGVSRFGVGVKSGLKIIKEAYTRQ